jgi:hypothetical protein
MSYRFKPTAKCVWLWLSLLVAVEGVVAGLAPSGWLAEGLPTATPFYVNTGNAEGPTVLLIAGMHGDEPAGPCAAEEILSWPLRRGKLIILPRANVLALAANSRITPGDPTNSANLNRAFPPKAGGENTTRRLATAIWELVETQKPDWVIDLHEGSGFRSQATNTVGSSIIPATSPEARQDAELMVRAVNETITETNRLFMLLRQPVQGSLARAAADDLGLRSMIVETSIRSQPLSLRARQHRLAVHALLQKLDMLDPSATPNLILGDGSRTGRTAVAVYDGGGIGGKGVPNVLAQLGRRTNFVARRVCPEDIRAGVLAQFDAVMFTGGSGSGQAKALGKDGRAEVKRFVESGGGYIGICAGAYLACNGFSWGLGIIDAKTLSPLWQRGTGQVELELTEQGRTILGERTGQFDCLYFQGPIVGPAEVAVVPDYDVLAFYRTEIANNNTPKGIIVNSPAIFSGHFGRGRVVCFSPHPEQTKGLEDFVPRAVAWVSAQENKPAAKP